jgi:hypothetical protein
MTAAVVRSAVSCVSKLLCRKFQPREHDQRHGHDGRDGIAPEQVLPSPWPPVQQQRRVGL